MVESVKQKTFSNWSIIGAVIGAGLGLVYALTNISFEVFHVTLLFALMSDIGELGLLGFLLGLFTDWLLKRYKK